MSLQSPRGLVRFVMTWFAGHYEIRLEEAEKGFDEYLSVNDLFTRKLKSGIRPIGGDLVHPADSKVAQAGSVDKGQLLQAKSWTYSLEEFLGNVELSETLSDGYFTTYYLCPTDYHRVHSPVDGRVLRVRHLAGTLWPVNPTSVKGIKGLFVKNERVVFEIETVFGVMALVMVGATNVGKIATSIGPDWLTNVSGRILQDEYEFTEDCLVKAGDELGVFHMGSTVICVWPDQAGIDLSSSLGSDVLYGQPLRGTKFPS